MRRWRVRVAVIVAIAVVFLIASRTLFAPDPVTVDVHRVSRGTVEETVTNSRAGTVKADRRAKLSPELGGNAIAIPYQEGDQVEAGEVVLRLEDSLQRARLSLTERDLETAKAQSHQACLASERAARELTRILRLAEEEIVSTDLLDEVQNAAETSKAACEAARATEARATAAVDLAEVELEKMKLRAPFSGIIAEMSIEVGEWTSPSPPALPIPPVVDLIDPKSIYISAPMDEVDSARISSGQNVRVTVDSHRGQDFPGTVTRVAAYVLDIEAQNRTVEIDVELDDRRFATSLLPGTSADVEVIIEVHDGVTRIPTSALFEGNRVLMVQDGRLVERQVEIGLKNWNFTEILEGLQPDDLVVTTLDRPEIKAGARVQIAQSTTPDGNQDS